MQATDPDCGVNAMVNYTLGSDGLESEQLLVHSETGDICVRSPLDREVAPYLELPVIATDRGMCHFCFYNAPINISVNAFHLGETPLTFNLILFIEDETC